MSTKKRPSQDDDYIKELIRWQRHQYSPGEYLGGDLPPYLRFPTRAGGYLLVCLGVVTGASYAWSLYQSPVTGKDWLGLIFPALLVLLYLAAGIVLIKKSKR